MSEEEINPPVAKATEDAQEEEEFVAKYEARFEQMEALLEKAVGALETVSSDNARLSTEISKLKADAHVPPTMDTEDAGEAKLDTTKGKPGVEGAVGAVKDDTAEAGKIVRKTISKTDLENMIEKAVAARTPNPSVGDAKEGSSTLALIRKAVEIDRENCGGSFGGNGDSFGFKSGRGDDLAREKTAHSLAKMMAPKEAGFL